MRSRARWTRSPLCTAAVALALAAAVLAATAATAPRASAAAAPTFTLSDPRGDDHGDGSLLYPERNDLKPGDLDLLSFSARPEKGGTLFEAVFARAIRKPTREPTEGGGPSLDVVARHDFYTFNIDVYIDQDRVTGSGATAMLPGRRAEVEPEFAWERVVCLAPGPHEAEELLRHVWLDAAKEQLAAAMPHPDEAAQDSLARRVEADLRARVCFPTRIRVSGPRIQFFVPEQFLGGPARASWAYVVAVSGANLDQRLDVAAAVGLRKQAPASLMILPVSTGHPQDAFGGAQRGDSLLPPLVDILAPAGTRQESLLRDYDLRTGRPARLPGVVPAEEMSKK
jgi:glucodextranase-like protein